MKEKNKLIAIISAVVVVVVVVVVAVVIATNNGNKGGDEASNNNGTTSNSTETRDDGVNGTSTESSDTAIVGKWKFYDPDFGSMDFIYTFNVDGTGNYYASGTDMPFTYEIDGSNLTINYESGPFETEYEINGDTLNVKDSGGNDTLYRKM